ncbi:hypothetical protein SASPL_106367 [Salvia splendens]|uniref:Non-structural maintenance of chromosomes element 1 homolog n=1 Tax=Salvia splendens TaxID=180675 RepID=A0A8X8YN64_SALSN|nr:non-structural maintenance of chromosomes element 1 homolog [Salvia splendens]KAG6434725.1 hypothetical protein SASPL_106367 [Salvia splendens]
MAALSWRHHTLIQSLLSRGTLKEDDFASIFLQLTVKNSGSRRQQERKLFNEYLKKINAELSCVQLELRACRNQYDGHVYYGVVNNVEDDQSKLGTKYTVPQIAFYKGIVEDIIRDAEGEGCIYNTAALNIRLESQVHGATDSQSQGGAVQIPPAFKNFSMSQKEKTLDQLVNDQWLCSTPEGKIGIGVRSFLDLRSWFRTNEVPSCEVCNEAAIKAQLCPNEACNVRLHSYCLKKKFSGQRGERVCSGCGTQLQGSTVKAELVEEITNADVHLQYSQRTESSRKRSRRSNREANADIDDTGDDSSLTSATMSKTKRVTRSSDRLSIN